MTETAALLPDRPDRQSRLDESYSTIRQNGGLFKKMFTLASLSAASSFASYATDSGGLVVPIVTGVITVAAGGAAILFFSKRMMAMKEAEDIHLERHVS